MGIGFPKIPASWNAVNSTRALEWFFFVMSRGETFSSTCSRGCLLLPSLCSGWKGHVLVRLSFFIDMCYVWGKRMNYSMHLFGILLKTRKAEYLLCKPVFLLHTYIVGLPSPNAHFLLSTFQKSFLIKEVVRIFKRLDILSSSCSRWAGQGQQRPKLWRQGPSYFTITTLTQCQCQGCKTGNGFNFCKLDFFDSLWPLFDRDFVSDGQDSKAIATNCV